MTTIDWAAMEKDLLEQKRGLEQELADVEGVIHAVQQRSRPKLLLRARPAPESPKRAKPHKNGRAKAGQATTASAERDALKAQAKILYEKGEIVEKIAEAVGKTSVTIYGWASAGGWKRPAAD